MALTSAPPKFKKMLNLYGNEIITDIIVGRNPIDSNVSKFLNTLSGNKLNEELKKKNYDDLFHLYLTVKTANGNYFEIDKTAILNITQRYNWPKKDEYISIKNDNKMNILTLNKMMAKTQQLMGNNFQNYSARNNNCQDFIISILTANNLIRPEYKEFIKQDAEELLFGNNSTIEKVKSGIMENISDVATNLAGIYETKRQEFEDINLLEKGKDFLSSIGLVEKQKNTNDLLNKNIEINQKELPEELKEFNKMLEAGYN